MVANSISWFSDVPPAGLTIPVGLHSQRIEECAVTNAYVPMVSDGDVVKVRLANTDPKSWNLYMFPFEAEKIRIDLAIVVDESERLPLEIIEICQRYQNTSERTIRTQFEIKRSASSGKITLYVFNYEQVDLGYLDDCEDTLTLEINPETVEAEILRHKDKLASNVPDVLRLIAKSFAQ